MPRPRLRRTTHQSRRVAPPQTQPRALYCVPKIPRKRPSTKAMGSTEHNPFFELLQQKTGIFQKNPLYIDITKPKSYKDGENDAEYIMMHVKSQTPGVFNAHVSVVSFFDPRSQDIGKVRPLEHHLHLSVRYRGQSEESPRTVRIYLKHRQGKKPKCKYVDNSGKPALDKAIQAQIEEEAIKFSQPLLELMDEQINELEGKISDLKERTTILNSQLARATEPDQKLDLVRKLYALHQKGLKILTSPHYRQLTLIRDNHTSSIDTEGFHTPGLSTKNRYDRILSEVLKQRIPILRQAITQLESEAAAKEMTESQASATNLPAKPRRNNKKHKKTQAGKRQTQPRKSRIKIPEDPLASYLKKANNWTQALTQAWDAFAENDQAHWHHSLQDEAFTSQCILFDADSEILKALCQPENIDFLRDLLCSQREALIAGIDDNPETIITIFKELIRARNLDGIFALNDELNLNADEFLFKYTRKSLIHHMADFATQDDNEKSHVRLLSNLCDRGFPLPHIDKGCRTEYKGRFFRFSGLAYAAHLGLFQLAEACGTKAGATDQLCASQQQPTAHDFSVIAKLEYGESPATYRARLALASSHTPSMQQHTLTNYGDIFVQHIHQSKENKLGKLIRLIDALSDYIIMHLPHESHTKQELLNYIHATFIETAQTSYEHAVTRKQPKTALHFHILKTAAWYALLKLSINIVQAEESLFQQYARVWSIAKEAISLAQAGHCPRRRTALDQQAGDLNFKHTHISHIFKENLMQLLSKSDIRTKEGLATFSRTFIAWTPKRFNDLRHAKAQYEARASAQRAPLPLAAPVKQESQKPRDTSHLFFDSHAEDNTQQSGSRSNALPSLRSCHVL
ncbi:hypothetical protein PsalN5692_01076 [Piscirickettsia salmonis]|nr:hypothetical protein PsalN5692_01076 [Piscirickettsia salmonis]